jgi:hypothetical protein
MKTKGGSLSVTAAMISRCTSSISKEHVVSPRLLNSNSTCFQACCWRSQILPDFSSALPVLSPVLPDFSSVLPGLSPALPGAPRHVVGTPRCTPCCHRTAYIHLDYSPLLPCGPQGDYFRPVLSRIWQPWDSGPSTSRGSQRLPEASRGSQRLPEAPRGSQRLQEAARQNNTTC